MDRRQGQELQKAQLDKKQQDKASTGEGQSVSVDGSDTESVKSSASRKKKSTKQTYVYVSDEECDTLKDKFWRDLEEGKINVFGNDMYSKVKGQGRSSRPTSFSGMFTNETTAERESTGDADESRPRKRLRRENSSSSSVSGSVISESGRHLRTRRRSISKQSSVESETSESVPSTGTALRRKLPRNKPETKSGETSGGVEGGGGKETRSKSQESKCESEKVNPVSSPKPDITEEPESPVRERAPIVVIRRSADGNGYTQKLVEGRPRAKSSSSSDEKSPTKTTERKHSPTHEIVKTDVISPTTIKITTRCKASPEVAMDTSNCKLRLTRTAANSVTSSLIVSHQMADLCIEDIKQSWGKKDPKLKSCHIPLYDITSLGEVMMRHRQSTDTEVEEDKKNNSIKTENVDKVDTDASQPSTSAIVQQKESPARINSPSSSLSLSVSKSNNSESTDSSGRERIPILRISSSPPTCRCKTEMTSTQSQNSQANTTYRVETVTTVTSVPSQSQSKPICKTEPTCKLEPPGTPQGLDICSMQQSQPVTTEPESTVPTTTSLSDSSCIDSLIESTGLKSETLESFLAGLSQQDEEIPGLGDILPLAMRPDLEPDLSSVGSHPSPPRTTVNTMGNTLPPIITCQTKTNMIAQSTSSAVMPEPFPQTLPSPVQTQISPYRTPPCSLQNQTSPLQTSPLSSHLPPHHPSPMGQRVPSQPSQYGSVQLDLRALSQNFTGTDASCQGPVLPTQHITDSFPDITHGLPDPAHARPPYPTPSPTQYSCSSSSMMSPFGPDPSVLSPAPHLEPMSPMGYLSSGPMQPSPSPISVRMESPRYSQLEESCNQFNDVDMRRASIPPQVQQMNRSAGAAPTRTSTGYNPYSPHQGASPYATSTGSPAAWSMSSPSPGTPGGPVNPTQPPGSSNCTNKFLDDTAFDFDLLEVDPSLWDQKHPAEKNTETVELTNLELKNAVKNNDYETVRRALCSGKRYDLEMRDEAGVTLLMIAAARSFDDVLELLVLNSANINARSKNGSTALMFAAENGNRCTVELLLIMGAHMNVQMTTGDTALTKAVRNGNKHIVRLLLDHGANFSSPSYLNDLMAMKVAKQRNQTEIMEILNKHISWVTLDFEKQVNITLNNTASILCALFPMQCFALSESDHITITFNHELQPTLPGVGVLLFIAHARITSSEVRCRFYGPCAVNSATLNGYQLHPLTEEANFVMSFSPLYNGRNDLEIKTVKAPTSRAKLVVCAYKAQLSLPPE